MISLASSRARGLKKWSDAQSGPSILLIWRNRAP